LRRISPSVTRHAALIALARVEGKSPVNYLSTDAQQKLQVFTKDVLASSENLSVSELFKMSAK
jgi:hypothetical protein